MGFDRALVLEVFFACNKNEELAANYLLDHMHEFEDWGIKDGPLLVNQKKSSIPLEPPPEKKALFPYQIFSLLLFVIFSLLNFITDPQFGV